MSAGKGDTPRPLSVSDEEYGRRWALAFGHIARGQERIEHEREVKARRIGQIELELEGPRPLLRPAESTLFTHPIPEPAPEGRDYHEEFGGL